LMMSEVDLIVVRELCISVLMVADAVYVIV
jgi:hypothetical protein